MLLKTDINIPIDNIKINFDTEGLWVLNIALAVVMFGVSLGISFFTSETLSITTIPVSAPMSNNTREVVAEP